MKSYKNGETIAPEEMSELEAPVFYLVQLDFGLKLGQSVNALYRWQTYYRHYNGDFKILHLIRFRRASKGYSYRESDTWVPRNDWSAQYERDVISRLKVMKVKPFYYGDPVSSSEYYRLADKRKVLKAISDVNRENERAGDLGKATRNRHGLRKR